MNTKNPIEFIKTFKTVVTSIDIENGEGKAIEEYNDKIDEVIELLQNGKKHEEMWGKLKKRGNELGLFMENVPINLEGNLDEFMEEFEKKYYPKPVKKRMTVDIDKLRSELIIMNEKLLRKYFPIKDGEINEFDLWRKEI